MFGFKQEKHISAVKESMCPAQLRKVENIFEEHNLNNLNLVSN